MEFSNSKCSKMWLLHYEDELLSQTAEHPLKFIKTNIHSNGIPA